MKQHKKQCETGRCRRKREYKHEDTQQQETVKVKLMALSGSFSGARESRGIQGFEVGPETVVAPHRTSEVEFMMTQGVVYFD